MRRKHEILKKKIKKKGVAISPVGGATAPAGDNNNTTIALGTNSFSSRSRHGGGMVPSETCTITDTFSNRSNTCASARTIFEMW